MNEGVKDRVFDPDPAVAIFERMIEEAKEGTVVRVHAIDDIEKGKAADMVVLNQNLFEIDPDSIIDCKVVYTIFAGKIVYNAKMPE